MTAARFDPWAELAVLENADCEGAPARVAKPANRPLLRCRSTSSSSSATVAPPSNVPAEWIDGVDRITTLAIPTAIVRPQLWRVAARDARCFLRDWGAQAAALGWTTIDVFGAHPTRPAQRIDCAGLVLLLHGDPVLAITAEAATTRKRSGAILTYYRRPRPGAVPMWELG